MAVRTGQQYSWPILSLLTEIDGVVEYRHDIPATSVHHQLSGITLAGFQVLDETLVQLVQQLP